MKPKAVERRWENDNHLCIVAAPGPSLTSEVANRCKGFSCVAIKESWQLFPWADALYACDAKFWHKYQGCSEFKGEKWSTHDEATNQKLEVAEKYNVKLVLGRQGEGFSFESRIIHYGSNSGFQAVNLALLLGAKKVILVGFDMHDKNGRYFFSATGSNNHSYTRFMQFFDRAANMLPKGIEILNATPGSAMKSFPIVELDKALEGN